MSAWDTVYSMHWKYLNFQQRLIPPTIQYNKYLQSSHTFISIFGIQKFSIYRIEFQTFCSTYWTCLDFSFSILYTRCQIFSMWNSSVEIQIFAINRIECMLYLNSERWFCTPTFQTCEYICILDVYNILNIL